MTLRQKQAFTLIELLIVVAIIAILAAIAVPNFLEAQVRSKVARAEADMRSVATALETYVIDFNHYPLDGQGWSVPLFSPFWAMGHAASPPWFSDQLGAGTYPLFVLTTPKAYLTSIFYDPFWRKRLSSNYPGWDYGANRPYSYGGEYWRRGMLEINQVIMQAEADGILEEKHIWSLTSIGPDTNPSAGGWYVFGQRTLERYEDDGTTFNFTNGCIYDATNGTQSAGDIVRVGP